MTATCPECGGEVVPQGNEEVCVVCGLVRERLVCDEKYVSFTSVDHHEKITSASRNPLWNRGNRVHVKTQEDRRDDTVFHLIQSFEAPDYIRQTAWELARKFFRAGGDVRSIGSYEDFICALVYYSYRVCREVPLLDTGDVEKVQTKARRIHWTIKNAGIHVPQVEMSPRAHEWIPVIARRMGRLDVVDDAQRILAKLPLRSQMPQTRAAVSIYRALEVRGEPVTYREVAEAAGINPSTLSKCHKQLFGNGEASNSCTQNVIPVRGIAASEWLTVLHKAMRYLYRDQFHQSPRNTPP
jgi:transcription initiation factor TFIIIB Brf1 subunit/transcription initiation factor TFIIB